MSAICNGRPTLGRLLSLRQWTAYVWGPPARRGGLLSVTAHTLIRLGINQLGLPVFRTTIVHDRDPAYAVTVCIGEFLPERPWHPHLGARHGPHRNRHGTAMRRAGLPLRGWRRVGRASILDFPIDMITSIPSPWWAAASPESANPSLP